MSYDDILRKDYGVMRLGSEDTECAPLQLNDSGEHETSIISVVIINNNGHWMKFNSAKDAAHAIGTTPSDVSRTCRRNKEHAWGTSDFTAKGWRCYFESDEQWKEKTKPL